MSFERGQATVELALCLPLVAAVLAGLVEVGLLAGDHVRLWHAAREAARIAVVDADPASARDVARRVGPEGLSIEISPQPAHRVQGEPLTVELSFEPDGRIPVVGAVAALVEMHASATMRIEQP